MPFIRWNAIRRAIDDGHKWFEMSGANTRRLCDAKSQFSPVLFAHFQMRKCDLVGSVLERTYSLLQKKFSKGASSTGFALDPRREE